MSPMSPNRRRLLYVVLFETIAVFFSTLLMKSIGGGSSGTAVPLAILVSVIALIWNYIFNSLFERAEKRFNWGPRTLLIRILHSLAFQCGLVFIVVPLFMVWYNLSIYEAFVMEAAILIFFLVYTFVFTWIFDKIFPLSAARGA